MLSKVQELKLEILQCHKSMRQLKFMIFASSAITFIGGCTLSNIINHSKETSITTMSTNHSKDSEFLNHPTTNQTSNSYHFSLSDMQGFLQQKSSCQKAPLIP